MTHVLAAVAGILLGAAAVTLPLRARRRRETLTPAPRRILFPFIGESLSRAALDSAIRIARFDGATLVPAFLASVPLHSPLQVPLPRQCDVALPLLEAIEQRAYGAGVPVDARIERGRTHRHALRNLMAVETFERIVVAAGTGGTSGFSDGDVAWLLREAPGEIVVIRPADESRIVGLPGALEGGPGLGVDRGAEPAPERQPVNR